MVAFITEITIYDGYVDIKASMATTVTIDFLIMFTLVTKFTNVRMFTFVTISIWSRGAWGSVVVKALRY